MVRIETDVTSWRNTPIGPISLTARQGAITGVDWGMAPETGASDPLLTEAFEQLAAYFDGSLREFDLPLAPDGGPLQQDVCAAMSAIPFGETRTYGDIAKDLGVPAQAVGQACGGNSIAIIIPCHRVLGANGLGGFSARGGVETKVWLLKHEGAASLLI